MKLALVTTTIHVPRILKLYRKIRSDIQFFVAADEKTPDDAYRFCAGIPDCEIYSPNRQRELGYECSSLLGWNCIQRRNIAVLEAVKWGAEIIYSYDDDNLPVGVGFFNQLRWAFLHDYYGIKAAPLSGWFDGGSLLTPPIRQRGFPVALRSDNVFEPVTDARIGVVSGLILGDSDMDAHTRLTNAPMAHGVSELAQAGVVSDPRQTWTVFNTQNTAYVRELAPAMFCTTGIGRHDDIFASLIAQKIMRNLDLHVRVGPPFTYQQRNQHDLLKDMRDELFGMTNILDFAKWLDAFEFDIDPDDRSAAAAVKRVREIYENLQQCSFWPSQSSEPALAYLNDIEKIL